jgi:hypothetical protein
LRDGTCAIADPVGPQSIRRKTVTTRIARAFRGGFAIIVTLGMALCVAGVARGQSVIAGWDFQTTTNGGTAAIAAPDTPRVFTANVGSGTLYLDGTNGSSAWVTATSGNELTSFAGSAVNAESGMSTTTTSPACLVPVYPSALTSNGKSMVFKVSMAGKVGLAITYACQRTSAGFTTHAWSYSSDGVTWNALSTQTITASSFALVSLPTTLALDGAANAYLRLTVSGATAASGNNRIDNVVFKASDSLAASSVVASGGASAATDGWTLATNGNAGSFQGNSADNGGG